MLHCCPCGRSVVVHLSTRLPCGSSTSRPQAVQRLDAIVAASAGSEAAAAAGAALLRRLQDDSPSVVQAVLGCASLLQLPQAALADGLAACFDSAIRQVGGRSASQAGSAGCVGQLMIPWNDPAY